MLLRCVGFSWAKPSVTKSSTHPSVSSVKTYAGILRVAPHSELRTQVSAANETVNRGVSHPVVSTPLNPFKIKVSRTFHCVFSCFFLFVFFVYFVVSIPINPFKISGLSAFCRYCCPLALATFHWSAAPFLWFQPFSNPLKSRFRPCLASCFSVVFRFACVIFLFFRGHFCGFSLFLGQKSDAVCCEIG